MSRYEILRNSKKGLSDVEKRELRKGQLESKKNLSKDELEEITRINYDIKHHIGREDPSATPLGPIYAYKFFRHEVV